MKPIQETRVWTAAGDTAHVLRGQAPFELGEPVVTRCGLTLEAPYTLWLVGVAPRRDCGNCTKGAP